MLVPKRLSAVKKSLYTASIVVLIAIIGYLVFTNFIADKIEFSKPLQVSVKVLVVPKIETTFADSFLTQSPYIDLQQNGVLPVTVNQMGRSNPFIKPFISPQ